MKYKDFYKTIQKPYFTTTDISLRGLNVFNYQLSLWNKEGIIVRLKRGFYAFRDRQNSLTANDISFLMYEPSYISLETALSVYGFIPDIPHSITAITSKTTRSFTCSFGHFIYRSVKPSLFFGYTPKSTVAGKYLIAEPEKALLDFLYLNMKSISSMETLESYRFNYELIESTINKEKMKNYLKVFNSKKLNTIITNLFELCSHTNK